MNEVKALILLTILFLTGENSLAQATPNPCDFPNTTCATSDRNTIINSFGTDEVVYSSVGTSMPFWFAIGDSSSGVIDTTLATNLFVLTKLSGPGAMLGVSGTLPGYYSYLSDISFTQSGTYEIKVSTSGTDVSLENFLTVVVPPQVDFCPEATGGGCDNIKGNKIFAQRRSIGVIPVDAVVPIRVGVIDSLSGLLDSTYSGTIYVNKLSGPGMLYGTLSMSGTKWFDFTNLRFSEEGLYTIRFYEGNPSLYREDTVNVMVFGTPTGLKSVLAGGFKVYPNPVNNLFTISSKRNLKGFVIEVFTSSGQKILSQDITENGFKVSVNTSFLPTGVYMVNIKDSSIENHTFKIVK